MPSGNNGLQLYLRQASVKLSRRAFFKGVWRISSWLLILPILWIVWYVFEALYEGREAIFAIFQLTLVIFTLLAVAVLVRLVIEWVYNHLSPPAKVILDGIGDVVKAGLLLMAGAMLWHLYLDQDFVRLWVCLLFVGGWLIQIFRQSLMEKKLDLSPSDKIETV